MLSFGVQDPKRASGTAYRARTAFHAKTDKASDTLRISGTGVVDEIQIRIPEIVGTSIVTDDGRAFGTGGSSSFKMRIDS